MKFVPMPSSLLLSYSQCLRPLGHGLCCVWQIENQSYVWSSVSDVWPVFLIIPTCMVSIFKKNPLTMSSNKPQNVWQEWKKKCMKINAWTYLHLCIWDPEVTWLRPTKSPLVSTMKSFDAQWPCTRQSWYKRRYKKRCSHNKQDSIYVRISSHTESLIIGKSCQKMFWMPSQKSLKKT